MTPVPAWLQPPEQGFLRAAEVAQLEALFARLLPADRARGVPGAVDVGAGRFVDLLLARDDAVYVEISAWRKLYPTALAALTAYSEQTHGKPLTELSDDQVNDILGHLEKGTLPGLPSALNQPTLFKTLLRHCIQGCFADPRWGGNKDRLAWRWIGYLQSPEDLSGNSP
jgi:hypothetical protein